MEVTSLYSALQFHRKELSLPHFTFAELVNALKFQTDSDKYLMCLISCSLMRIVGRINSFEKAANALLQFYNSANKGRRVAAFENEFSQLSFLARVEVLSQITASCLAVQCAKYTANGCYRTQKRNEAESFISLGIDAECNEYFLLYPDVVVVISPNESVKIFDGEIKRIDQIFESKTMDQLVEQYQPDEHNTNFSKLVAGLFEEQQNEC